MPLANVVVSPSKSISALGMIMKMPAYFHNLPEMQFPQTLTEQQYAMIGRFSLAFNRLDFAVGFLLEVMLDIPEGEAAEAIATEGSFSSKTRRFTAFLQAIARVYSGLESDIRDMLSVLREAEQLGTQRNKYMHALASPLKESGLMIKRRAGKKKNKKAEWVIERFSAGDVRSLTKRAEDAVRDLREAVDRILPALDEQRKLKRGRFLAELARRHGPDLR